MHINDGTLTASGEEEEATHMEEDSGWKKHKTRNSKKNAC